MDQKTRLDPTWTRIVLLNFKQIYDYDVEEEWLRGLYWANLLGMKQSRVLMRRSEPKRSDNCLNLVKKSLQMRGDIPQNRKLTALAGSGLFRSFYPLYNTTSAYRLRTRLTDPYDSKCSDCQDFYSTDNSTPQIDGESPAKVMTLSK